MTLNYIRRFFHSSPESNYCHKITAFSSQLGSDNYVEHGFADINEASQWVGNSCGINCLQMILSHSLSSVPSLKDLSDLSSSYKSYDEEKGWIHSGLVSIGKYYGVQGRKTIMRSESKLVKTLHAGALVIASVKAEITDRTSHLIVISGIEKKDHTYYLLIHNPGTDTTPSKFNNKVELKIFMGLATGRMMLFSCNNKICQTI